VGFEGNDAPVEGFTLVSAPVSWSDIDSKPQVPDKQIKVLHTFSKLNALINGGGIEYQLCEMSPDRRYALVREGDSHTYYLVDVSTGKTRLLLKTSSSINSSVWGLYWVPDLK
jgi:hypothetical protein